MGAAASDPSLGTDRLRLHPLKHNLTDLHPQINYDCTQVSPRCPGPSGTQGCSALRCEEELRRGMDASLLPATTACSECSRDSCSPKHSNIPWGLLTTGQKAGLDHTVLPCAAPHWCPVAQDRREGSSPVEPTGDVTPPGEDRDPSHRQTEAILFTTPYFCSLPPGSQCGSARHTPRLESGLSCTWSWSCCDQASVRTAERQPEPAAPAGTCGVPWEPALEGNEAFMLRFMRKSSALPAWLRAAPPKWLGEAEEAPSGSLVLGGHVERNLSPSGTLLTSKVGCNTGSSTKGTGTLHSPPLPRPHLVSLTLSVDEDF